MRTLQAAVPFSGEDFALFLDRLPGTYTFLGVRAPGAAIETSYPYFGAFTPDERAIGHGVRATAGWLATRTRTAGGGIPDHQHRYRIGYPPGHISILDMTRRPLLSSCSADRE
ncbi:hypothetical protein [Nonomuraea sp. NPDC003709]|uniref:hypothetical protein n=1 Tax=Nonomuraea sp. NPDC003709 TaxID=3154450 RepID=UPI0033B648B2